MPGDVHWLGTRVSRVLVLIFAINAGTIIGDLMLGPIGGLIGAFAGFTITIQTSRVRSKRSATRSDDV